MASEILTIKEDYLDEFIEILEKGIYEVETNGLGISPRLRERLVSWIDDEKYYLRRLSNED